MAMYRDILLPTDGSEGAEQAVDEAIALAEANDATLHVVYVVDTSLAAGIPETETANLQQLLETAGGESIEAVRTRADSRGVSSRREIRYGPVDTAIVEYADEAAVDLIVMGTHGRSGLDRLLLGSVTDRVIRRASQPVLVISSSSSGQQG